MEVNLEVQMVRRSKIGGCRWRIQGFFPRRRSWCLMVWYLWRNWHNHLGCDWVRLVDVVVSRMLMQLDITKIFDKATST